MSRNGSGLFRLLTEHGIPEKGARLYLAACRAGPQTASELARLSSVGREEAYRIIERLTTDGLLTPTSARPQRFAPLAPDELVDRWIHRASERLHRLESDGPRVLMEWAEGHADLAEGDPRKFAVLEGRESIRGLLKKKVGTAEHQILVSATGGWLATMIDGGVDRALKEAHARGVKLKVVTDVEPPHLTEAKHFAAFTDLRHTQSPVSSRSVVIDGSGALVFVSGDDGGEADHEEPVAVWSAAVPFVQRTKAYHRRLWSTATRAEARFVELEDPPTAVLPVVSGRESIPFQRLKEIAKLGMRASGVRSFQLHLPELIEAIARQLGREIAEEVDGKTPEEVARALGRYYAVHTMGRLGVVKEHPLTLRVTGCFACTSDSPEIGRVMCPQLLRAVLETRLGGRWEVSKPDPSKHAARGCLFTAVNA